ncbi:MAG: sulfite exporter TauE/SafE family protein [Rhodovibrionaceae bacterium]
MTDPLTLVIVAATFLLAGTVKGVIGLGLPTVSLAILTLALDLPSAMALLLVPSLVTNLWQAGAGGHALTLLRRLWSFLLPAAVFVWFGALALRHVEFSLLTALLGLLLIVYAGLGLAGFAPRIRRARQAWAGPVFGAVNGGLTGMTGSFTVPGVLYLQAIGLPRDQLIQAMGMLFAVSTLALAVALGDSGLLSAELGAVSAAALIPALGGMVLGQRIRRRLPEAAFRRAFFIALLVLGGVLAASAG